MRSKPESSLIPPAGPSGFQIGQRVHVDGSETEFVVVHVDRETGVLELLRLSPARIEADVPAAKVHLSETGIHLVKGPEGR